MVSDSEDQPLLAADEIDACFINKPLSLSPKDEEHIRSYMRKCDRRLLLYICVGYALSSLNKMALSNAKIAGLGDDLNLHGYDINLVLGVYYLGSFIFQLPSNLVLKSVKPTY
ncbi:hypothetical protein FBU31_000663 [Coemansia sp. 'formosensis']|nr:hypothetical protein FBU31_000663 [Coemansia sp. 'formosensis']